VRTIAWIIVVTACVWTAVTAAIASEDSEALRRDVEQLIASNDTASLFTATQRVALRKFVSHSDTSVSINRLLASRAPIEVTINPEARVSVRRSAARIPKLICGRPTPLLLRIINEALVTSTLRVRLTGTPVDDTSTSVQPIPRRLAGVSIEYRVLRLSLAHEGITDITLTFDAGAETEDLGSRATVVLLARCVNS
jgi:hypothetical protein